MRRLLCSSAILLTLLGADRRAHSAISEHDSQHTPVDSDHDGLSDDLEEALLIQFKPIFMVSRGDCSDVPAEFAPESPIPIVRAEDATIYGQVFPQQLWGYHGAHG